MGQKIVVGPFNRGLRNDVTPFNVDNDSFPTLINAYQWRARVKRKRGTSFLTHLARFFDSTISSYNPGAFLTVPTTSQFIVLDGTGSGNFFAGNGAGVGYNIVASSPNASIKPGTISFKDQTTMITYTDPAMDGTLSPSGTINYATGAFSIGIANAGHLVASQFIYYPNLPVMGLEDFDPFSTQFPGTIGFDTVFSYNINTFFPYDNYSVSFYKNPAVDATNLPGYVPKTNWTPTSWNGQNYQQFWTVNYQGALWATNGINVPFATTNIGMQFKLASAPGVIIILPGPPATANITILGHGLVVGDFVFVNEVVGITGINFQTGYVITRVDDNNVVVEFPFATLGGVWISGGMIQYLTNRSDFTKDCLRWYDGDPTDGIVANPGFVQGKGWVNFAPPLNFLTAEPNFSVAELPLAQYYLVGARMIVPFKDRLLFLGPVVQTSSAGSQVYLQDTIIFSQNGTPYYTASYTNTPNAAIDTPTSSTNVFHQILVPINQTATSTAYFEDQTGFGGFITAGLDQPIITSSSNEDVLIIGFPTIQTRLVYSGNDIVPFNFFLINSELGSGSTFSAINMDQGVLTRGERGFVITGQTQTQRIDLEIPDEVFEIRLTENGPERICAQRDFINEWAYFTYPVNSVNYTFPNQTLLYNYRDNSWAIFRESYTTYGQFRRLTGFVWSNVGTFFATWNLWNDPWNAGESTLLQPEVIAGNQQGFVMVKDEGTGEGNSLFIQGIAGNVVTSPDHSLNDNDFIIISGAIGTVGQQINGRIFQIFLADENTFQLDPPITAATYLGGGLIKRLYVPFIQTKQFPVAWEMARKTRLGAQQYLLTTTQNSQIQLLIYLSQNGSSPYNTGNIVPAISPQNNGLEFSTILYTCPESTNLGLTPANTNLQIVTAQQQSQIWHRINTSLLGDTVQLGFTMSDEQMTSLDIAGEPFNITGATQANPCVLTCDGQFSPGQLILIQGVIGMTQLNGNNYNVISTTPTTVTIEIDSTGFTAYISGGTATVVANSNHFAEIELHGIILDVSPSQLLA